MTRNDPEKTRIYMNNYMRNKYRLKKDKEKELKQLLKNDEKDDETETIEEYYKNIIEENNKKLEEINNIIEEKDEEIEKLKLLKNYYEQKRNGTLENNIKKNDNKPREKPKENLRMMFY